MVRFGRLLVEAGDQPELPLTNLGEGSGGCPRLQRYRRTDVNLFGDAEDGGVGPSPP